MHMALKVLALLVVFKMSFEVNGCDVPHWRSINNSTPSLNWLRSFSHTPQNGRLCYRHSSTLHFFILLSVGHGLLGEDHAV